MPQFFNPTVTDTKDPDECNDWRAGKADTAISAYYGAYYGVGAEEDEVVLGDLLVDIRHYCDAKGFDIHKLLDTSYLAYLEELELAGGPATKVGEEI